MWSRIWSSAQSDFSMLWKAISGWICIARPRNVPSPRNQRRAQILVREGTRRLAAAQSAKPAVAVLVFFARAAGAHIVAADLAPGGRILGIDGARGAVAVPGEGRSKRRAGEVVLARVRIDVVRLHIGQVLLLLF